jgi:hypothetical protein
LGLMQCHTIFRQTISQVQVFLALYQWSISRTNALKNLMPKFHQREQLTSPDTSLTLRKLIPLPLKVTVKFNIHKALFIFVSKVCNRKWWSIWSPCCRKPAWSNSIKRCIQE